MKRFKKKRHLHDITNEQYHFKGFQFPVLFYFNSCPKAVQEQKDLQHRIEELLYRFVLYASHCYTVGHYLTASPFTLLWRRSKTGEHLQCSFSRKHPLGSYSKHIKPYKAYCLLLWRNIICVHLHYVHLSLFVYHSWQMLVSARNATEQEV